MKLSDDAILVNTQDRVIGNMNKVEVHRGTARRHRAISVFLFNSKGELLTQQRSAKKIVAAQQWVNTCCGNVLRGETRKQCAYRRLKEEMGISEVILKKFARFEYQVQCNAEFSEWEIDDVYVGTFEGIPNPNPEEVQAFTWMDFKKFTVEVLTGDSKYAPWVKEILTKTNIIDTYTLLY